MGETRYKILLIEDDKLDQMAFMRMVEDKELSYDCSVAGSVAEAHSILSSEKFDIIIIDYSLGDGTAFDILDSVGNIPVILVTGAGDEGTAVKAWKAGAYDYLIKDHERNYLKAVPITVENAIRYKRIEARLRLLSHAIVSTDDSVYITDLDNKITFVNRAFCETYGYTEDEIIGKDSSILWKEGFLTSDTKNIYRVVSGWEVGFFHKRKDGSEFPVSVSRSGVKDEDGNEIALVVIARDISERMQIENELRVENRHLKKQNRLRRELAIAICHQLMAPMVKFKHLISNAMTGVLGRIGPELQESLELIDKDIEKAKGVISNFLEISQIDANRLEGKLTELGLRSVALEVLRALAPLVSEKDIELESLMPDADVTIDADWSRMVQVLTNLVGEATSCGYCK